MHDKINLKQVKISQREKYHSMKKKPLQLFKKLHIQGDTYAALYSSEWDQEEKIRHQGEKNINFRLLLSKVILSKSLSQHMCCFTFYFYVLKF